VAGSFLSLNYC